MRRVMRRRGDYAHTARGYFHQGTYKGAHGIVLAEFVIETINTVWKKGLADSQKMF